jgi:predicted nucleic acid-binding protein
MLDVNTSRAAQLVRSLPRPLVYSALHRLEIRNAFSLAVFRGHQTEAQVVVAWRNLEADLKARVLLPVSIRWHAAFRRAAQIASRETPQLGSRSFDILHIACAEQISAKEFLTFDQRQRRMAEVVGFQVRP